MKKSVIYMILWMLLDFIFFSLLFFFAGLLITKDVSIFASPLTISMFSIAAIKVILGYVFKTYHLIWRYSIRRNLVRLIVISLSISVVANISR